MRDYRNDEELARDAAAPRRRKRTNEARKSASATKARAGDTSEADHGSAPSEASKSAAPPHPSDRPEETKTAAAGSYGQAPRGYALWPILVSSAEQVYDNKASLKAQAESLREALRKKIRMENMIVAVLLQFFVGLAFFLIYDEMTDKRVQAELVNPTAPFEAPLMGLATRGEVIAAEWLFSRFALIILVTIVIYLIFGVARGFFSTEIVDRNAGRFGRAISVVLHDIDARLKAARARLTGDLPPRQPGADHMAREVSEAHIVGAEAALLFREAAFLVDDDGRRQSADEAAVHQFRDYIDLDESWSKTQWFFVGCFLGGFLATIAGVYLLTTTLGYTIERLLQKFGVDVEQIALIDHPRALGAFIVALLIFLFAIILGEFFALFLMRGFRNARMRGAVNAIRGAIVSDTAPSARDIADQVQALGAIFEERLKRLDAPAQQNAAGHRAGANADSSKRAPDAPSWRRPPEKPRFVSQGFQAAPKPWLAGAPLTDLTSGKARRSPSKRGPFGLGKSERD